MTYLIVLGLLALVPLLVIAALRVNGAIAFMSLCVGSVLVSYTSSDVNSVVNGFSVHGSLTTYQWVQILLLVVPFILTILFTRGSVHGSKKFTNLLPALATGLLFALLLTPLFPADVQRQIHTQAAWRQLSDAQTAIVLSGAAFSLFFLLLTHRTSGEHHKKHSKH